MCSYILPSDQPEAGTSWGWTMRGWKQSWHFMVVNPFLAYVSLRRPSRTSSVWSHAGSNIRGRPGPAGGRGGRPPRWQKVEIWVGCWNRGTRDSLLSSRHGTLGRERAVSLTDGFVRGVLSNSTQSGSSWVLKIIERKYLLPKSVALASMLFASSTWGSTLAKIINQYDTLINNKLIPSRWSFAAGDWCSSGKRGREGACEISLLSDVLPDSGPKANDEIFVNNKRSPACTFTKWLTCMHGVVTWLDFMFRSVHA